MPETQAIPASTGNQRSSTKHDEWKAKAAAPGDWVSTLLRGKHDGSSVLIEFRSGSKGAPMLANALPFSTIEGADAVLGIPALASECWEIALEHRQTLEGERYHYRIRVLSSLDEGMGEHALYESAWVEAPRDLDGDVLSIDMRGGSSIEQLLSGMVIKLFSANIQLTRASGTLVRQVTEGLSAGVESQFSSVNKVKEMASELIEQQRTMAQEEAAMKEVEEFGKTARKWMEIGSEEKIAKAGVKPPPIPKSRVKAAAALRMSITVGQLDALEKELGTERFETIFGLLKNASGGNMNDEQLGQVLDQALGEGLERFELIEVAEKAFSPKFVSSAHAIWQRRTLSVLVNGPEEASDAQD